MAPGVFEWTVNFLRAGFLELFAGTFTPWYVPTDFREGRKSRVDKFRDYGCFRMPFDHS